MPSEGELVTLDVGGTLFKTTLTTLRQYQGSMLATMFNANSGRPPAIKNEDGSYFIDRNPKAFAAILSYLRTRKVFPSYEGVTLVEVACEAEYFGLNELSEELCDPCRNDKEVLIFAYEACYGNRLFSLKVPANQSVYLSNLFDGIGQVGKLRYLFNSIGNQFESKKLPRGRAWHLNDATLPQHLNLLFATQEILYMAKQDHSYWPKKDFLWESPMKVQKEVFGNWDQYWAQATSVDIETKNDLFGAKTVNEDIVAVLIHKPDHYLRGGDRTKLKGAQAMRVRQLRRMGFKVMQLDSGEIGRRRMCPDTLTQLLKEKYYEALSPTTKSPTAST